jgi:hypothetical protein
MWQVHSLGQGEKIVSRSLPEGITVLFQRRGGPILYLTIRLDGGEPRAFNKSSLPIIDVNGQQILDLNECMETQRALTGIKEIEHAFCFAERRSVGVCTWSGVEVISPTKAHPVVPG